MLLLIHALSGILCPVLMLGLSYLEINLSMPIILFTDIANCPDWSRVMSEEVALNAHVVYLCVSGIVIHDLPLMFMERPHILTYRQVS